MDEVQPNLCKCGGLMVEGQALQNKVETRPYIAGVVDVNYIGKSASLVNCKKCRECGYSE